ncbi:MAG: hypothetical protein ACKOA9_00900 [Actinomycetota bacterium]
MVFLAPTTSIVVPIAQVLRQSPEVVGGVGAIACSAVILWVLRARPDSGPAPIV